MSFSSSCTQTTYNTEASQETDQDDNQLNFSDCFESPNLLRNEKNNLISHQSADKPPTLSVTRQTEEIIYLQKEEETNNQSEETDQEESPSQQERVTQKKRIKTSDAILVLSDSIYKGINQNKLAPKRDVNKQCVPGGTQEIFDHIEVMPNDETMRYSNVIIHSGTNDVGIKNINRICENIATTTAVAQQKWPSAKITVSGITYDRVDGNKNNIISEVNSQSKQTCAQFPHARILHGQQPYYTQPQRNRY